MWIVRTFTRRGGLYELLASYPVKINTFINIILHYYSTRKGRKQNKMKTNKQTNKNSVSKKARIGVLKMEQEREENIKKTFNKVFEVCSNCGKPKEEHLFIEKTCPIVGGTFTPIEEINLLPREYTPEEQKEMKEKHEKEKENRKLREIQVTIYPQGWLIDLLQESARANKRSLNKEILFILEKYFEFNPYPLKK